MEINEYFKNDYLTCGQTRDNFIFENCPNEFILEAQKSLAISKNGVKSCNLTIKRANEIYVEKTLTR